MGTTLRVMSIKKDFPLKLVYKMGYTLNGVAFNRKKTALKFYGVPPLL